MRLSPRLAATAAAAVTAAVLGTSAPALADTPPGTVNDSDVNFLTATHQTDLFEIAAGRLAWEKGQSKIVRDLGARFMKDHKMMDTAVLMTANMLAVPMPSTPTPDQVALAQQYLEAPPGPEFDALYLRTQIAGHRAALRVCDDELLNGGSLPVKYLVVDGMPVVKAHRNAASAAQVTLGFATPTPPPMSGAPMSDSPAPSA